jgi:hypothetical protein
LTPFLVDPYGVRVEYDECGRLKGQRLRLQGLPTNVAERDSRTSRSSWRYTHNDPCIPPTLRFFVSFAPLHGVGTDMGLSCSHTRLQTVRNINKRATKTSRALCKEAIAIIPSYRMYLLSPSPRIATNNALMMDSVERQTNIPSERDNRA